MKRKISYILLAILTFGLSTFLVVNLNKFFYFQQKETFVEEPFQILPKVEQTKTPNFIDFKDLTINGIGLDSTEENIVKTFGKPRLIKKQFNGCLDDQMKTFFYKGLELSLSENLETKKWEVFEIELTSNKWQLDSGIKIGDSIESVKQKIGKENSMENRSGFTILFYSNDNGGTNFHFRNNKLEKIYLVYTIC